MINTSLALPVTTKNILDNYEPDVSTAHELTNPKVMFLCSRRKAKKQENILFHN